MPTVGPVDDCFLSFPFSLGSGAARNLRDMPTSHPTPYTPDPTPCTLHPQLYTLDPTPCTFHIATLRKSKQHVLKVMRTRHERLTIFRTKVSEARHLKRRSEKRGSGDQHQRQPHVRGLPKFKSHRSKQIAQIKTNITDRKKLYCSEGAPHLPHLCQWRAVLKLTGSVVRYKAVILGPHGARAYQTELDLVTFSPPSKGVWP